MKPSPSTRYCDTEKSSSHMNSYLPVSRLHQESQSAHGPKMCGTDCYRHTMNEVWGKRRHRGLLRRHHPQSHSSAEVSSAHWQHSKVVPRVHESTQLLAQRPRTFQLQTGEVTISAPWRCGVDEKKQAMPQKQLGEAGRLKKCCPDAGEPTRLQTYKHTPGSKIRKHVDPPWRHSSSDLNSSIPLSREWKDTLRASLSVSSPWIGSTDDVGARKPPSLLPMMGESASKLHLFSVSSGNRHLSNQAKQSSALPVHTLSSWRQSSFAQRSSW
mmetsp:Transcript_570/g.909  ORF Transcript_570/g.909 Transcript_570/m.909 type:complete len:270 (+) Transcript_570:143-952(+)